jgi:hypothetical protein
MAFAGELKPLSIQAGQKVLPVSHPDCLLAVQWPLQQGQHWWNVVRPKHLVKETAMWRWTTAVVFIAIAAFAVWSVR